MGRGHRQPIQQPTARIDQANDWRRSARVARQPLSPPTLRQWSVQRALKTLRTNPVEIAIGARGGLKQHRVTLPRWARAAGHGFIHADAHSTLHKCANEAAGDVRFAHVGVGSNHKKPATAQTLATEPVADSWGLLVIHGWSWHCKNEWCVCEQN